MAKIKGAKEYDKFIEHKDLTRKQAMLAMCYECNGKEESGRDCQGEHCPLYAFQPYRSK